MGAFGGVLAADFGAWSKLNLHGSHYPFAHPGQRGGICHRPKQRSTN
jgi:hypothetical protein